VITVKHIVVLASLMTMAVALMAPMAMATESNGERMPDEYPQYRPGPSEPHPLRVVSVIRQRAVRR
jgi:hypothetical protein